METKTVNYRNNRPILISLSKRQFIDIFRFMDEQDRIDIYKELQKVLNVPFEKTTRTLSKSMQKALAEEKMGLVTKLTNHKNAVAEILG